jgi:hypothetical protein
MELARVYSNDRQDKAGKEDKIMPELKSMTAVKMLEALKNDVNVLITAISGINMIDIDDGTFDCIYGISKELSSISLEIIRITRILKKEG